MIAGNFLPFYSLLFVPFVSKMLVVSYFDDIVSSFHGGGNKQNQCGRQKTIMLARILCCPRKEIQGKLM